jgi:hypothetical protein
MVATRAIQGARGAMHISNIVLPIIHLAAGTRKDGTQALTVRHRNVSTPSGPSAPVGQALLQRPHPLQNGTSGRTSLR